MTKTGYSVSRQGCRRLEAIYREQLAGVPGIHIPPPLPPNIRGNHSYFPIEVDEAEYGMSRDELHTKLREYNIYTRRYFYPLVTDFACYKSMHTNDSLRVAKRVAERILCLPTYHGLDEATVETIGCIITDLLRR